MTTAYYIRFGTIEFCSRTIKNEMNDYVSNEILNSTIKREKKYLFNGRGFVWIMI